MERRVLFAIFLSFLVLYVYQALVLKPVPKPVGVNATETSAPAPPASGTSSSSSQAPAATAAGTAEAVPPAKPAATPLVADTAEREIRVETQDVIAVFT